MIQAAHYFFKGVYKHDLWRAALQMSYMSDSSPVSLGLFFVSHFAREMETSLNARVSLEETGSVQRRTTVPRPAFKAPGYKPIQALLFPNKDIIIASPDISTSNE